MRDQTVSYRGQKEDTISNITGLIASLQGIIKTYYDDLSELLEELHADDPLKLRAMIIKADMEKSFEWFTLFTETPKENIQTLLTSMFDQIDHKESILYKILQVLQSLLYQQQNLSSPSTSNTGRQSVVARLTNAFKQQPPKENTRVQFPDFTSEAPLAPLDIEKNIQEQTINRSNFKRIEQQAKEQTDGVEVEPERLEKVLKLEENIINDAIKRNNDRINSSFTD